METQTLEKPTFNTQDEFKRKPIAENIIRLLTSDIDLSPMVIDGGWGTGKTEFCQKLIRLMQQQHPDYQHVYIDAFRSDHSGEPLLALLAEIIKACTPEGSDEKLIEEHKDRIRRITKAAGFLMKTVAKAAVGHVLKQNTDDLAEELQQIMNDGQEADSLAETVTDAAATITSHTIDATVEALLKEQIEAEKNLKTLKACLKEFAEAKPIILFIDELDRCRPDYAVDMLEVIKHVFEVENVKVVLVTNTKQLRAAINHRYGVEVDAQKYLDKFLKYSFALPEVIGGINYLVRKDNLVTIIYFHKLIRSSPMFNQFKDSIYNEYNIDFISDMMERNNISLRETERFVHHLEIYLTLRGELNKERRIEYNLLIILGVFIFCFYPSLINDIYKERMDAKDIAQLFNIQSWPSMPEDRKRFNCADLMAVMLIRHSNLSDKRFIANIRYDEEYWQFHMDRMFLKNSAIFPQGVDGIYGVLAILKDIFLVLNLEKTPQ